MIYGYALLVVSSVFAVVIFHCVASYFLVPTLSFSSTWSPSPMARRR
jgi:hypothetical protein